MERGRHVAARAFNLDRIERLLKSKQLTVTKLSAPWEPLKYEFKLDGATVYTMDGPMEGPEWPPEALMAVIGISVQAMDLVIPPPDPTHNVSKEAKDYNRRMREQNAKRWQE